MITITKTETDEGTLYTFTEDKETNNEPVNEQESERN